MVYENFNDEIKIRPLKVEDWDPIMEISNRRFGPRYMSYEAFLERVEVPELNLVAEKDGVPIAWISAIKEDAKYMSELLTLDENKLLEDSKGKPILYIKTGIVHEDYSKFGIMKKMTDYVLDNAKNMGFGLVMSTSWKHDGIVPVMKIQLDRGFEIVGERHAFWKDDKDLYCVICHGRCHCDAVIFQKKL